MHISRASSLHFSCLLPWHTDFVWVSIPPPAARMPPRDAEPLHDCLWVIPFILSMTGSENGPVEWKVLYKELLGKFFLLPGASDDDSLPLALDSLVRRWDTYLFSHVSVDGAGWHQQEGREHSCRHWMLNPHTPLPLTFHLQRFPYSLVSLSQVSLYSHQKALNSPK